MNCTTSVSDALVVVTIEVVSSLHREATSTSMEDVLSTQNGVSCDEWVYG